MINPDLDTVHIEAVTYRRLITHLMRERTGVRDSDLMIVACFRRRETVEASGITMTREEARDSVLRDAIGALEGFA